MKRSSFLKSCGAFVALATTSITTFARQFRVGKAVIVKAGKARNDQAMALFEGDSFHTKVGTKDTDGDIYVFESSRIKEGGPSYHLHYEQDEYWYILKGEFLFKVGDEEFTAKEGDSVFGPRMVPHAFSKVGEGEAKLLMFFQPAGKMEALFQQISEGKFSKLTEEEKAKINHAHGVKRVGPPLVYQKKW